MLHNDGNKINKDGENRGRYCDLSKTHRGDNEGRNHKKKSKRENLSTYQPTASPVFFFFFFCKEITDSEMTETRRLILRVFARTRRDPN